MSSTILYYIGAAFVKLYSKIMFRMDVVNYTKMPKGPKIIVANHPTTSDPFLLTYMAKGQARVLVHEILFKVPLFGRYLKWSGHVQVITGEGKKVIDDALDLLNRKISVIIFIEGDVSPNGFFLEPKTGAARLAMLSGAPIVPIGIGVSSQKIKYINAVIKGTPVVETWYLRGPYAFTRGEPFNIFGNVENREKVKQFSKTIMEKVIELANQSTKRINGRHV